MNDAPAIALSTLRLELLRLVHRHDQPPEAVIGRAVALEAYVLSARARAPRRAGKPQGSTRR